MTIIIFGLPFQDLFGQGVPIKRSIFAQNAWVIAAPNYTNLNQYLPDVKLSRPTLCRIGGIEPNFRPLYKWDPSIFAVNTGTDIAQLVFLIDTLRGAGMEPIVQVGYNPVCTNTAISLLGNVSRANQAIIAGNVVAALKAHYGVKSPTLYIIANEPNLKIGNCNYVDSLRGYGYGSIGTGVNHADTVAAYIKDFAIKMRTADSTITLIGPEMTSFGNDSNYVINRMMQRIIKNQTNPPIMGKMNADGFNRYYLNVISYHDYLQSATSHNDIIAAPTKTANGFRTKLASPGLNVKEGLIDMLLTNGSGRDVSNTKLACTELNIDLKNGQDEGGAGNYNQRIIGYDNRSFIGAQWLADVFSQAMELSGTNTVTGKPESYMEYMNVWSIREGDCYDGMGYLSACGAHNGRKRPSFYHYQLLTQHMVGRFYRGSTNNSKVKTFASAETPYGFKVMVLNQDTVNDYNFQLNTVGNTNTVNITTYPLLLNFDFTGDPSISATTNSTYLSVTGATPNPIPKASTVVLFFDCYGNPVRRIDYTMQDAKDPGLPPHIAQIGQKPVDPSWISCSLMPFGLGGTLSSNTAFSNTIVPIASDLHLAPGVSLSFTNCIVVMADGTKIYGNRSNSITLKKTLMAGCDGHTFKGLELTGFYEPGEGLIIDSSVVVNATEPVYTDQIPSIQITNSYFINGNTGINLVRSQAFTCNNNVIGNFSNSGIRTSNTVPNYNSEIKGNYFMEVDTGMSFNNCSHNQMVNECNRVEFYQYGVSSDNCVLSNFGTSAVGAGNRFTKMNTLDQYHFLNHTGNAVTYYYDPAYSSVYASAPMNITMSGASANAACASVLSETCQAWPEDVGTKEWALGISNINVYPNPSNGSFFVKFPYASGKYKMSVYDMMGRVVLFREVDFTNDKAIEFEIKEKGLYIVSLQNGTKQSTSKIIVQ